MVPSVRKSHRQEVAGSRPGGSGRPTSSRSVALMEAGGGVAGVFGRVQLI